MKITILLLLIGVCCSISPGNCHSEKNIGEECFNYQKNKTGVCRLLDDCPEEKKLERITRDDDLKDICGFKLHVPVVCCLKPEPKTENPSTRICQRKCEEYSKETITNRCDIIPTFVLGGEDAKTGEFAHMAVLGYGEGNDINWGCGGSLISDQYILTAAHCMYKKSFSLGTFMNATKVRLGTLELNNNAHIQNYDIIERIRHPNYTRSKKYHDIALVKLSRKVSFTQWVRPACLHLGKPLDNSYYTVTGWGKLTHTSTELSKVLQKAVVELFDHKECNESYEDYINDRLKDGILDDRMICAAGRLVGKDTCLGDSGGPLQERHPNATCMYSIVGVTSFGQQSCGIAGIPAIYTRVSHYIDWIESIVWS